MSQGGEVIAVPTLRFAGALIVDEQQPVDSLYTITTSPNLIVKHYCADATLFDKQPVQLNPKSATEVVE